MSAWEDLKEIIRLAENVRQLQIHVKDIAEALNEIDRRLLTLEVRHETLEEKVMTAASAAAAVAASRQHEATSEKVARLQALVEHLDQRQSRLQK